MSKHQEVLHPTHIQLLVYTYKNAPSHLFSEMDMTREELDEWVCEHLKGCADCRKELQNTKNFIEGDLDLSQEDQDILREYHTSQTWTEHQQKGYRLEESQRLLLPTRPELLSFADPENAPEDEQLSSERRKAIQEHIKICSLCSQIYREALELKHHPNHKDSRRWLKAVD